jgi:nucleotide-binding universal stress UspA family protein
VETGLLHGHPAASLIEFADDYEPSLIVLGAKGLRATLGILLGGVAQQVVEHARWPVLIIRSQPIDWSGILIATDGSIYSQMAVDYFGIFPPLLDKEYHLVHVVPPLPNYDLGNIPRTWQIGTEVFQVSPIEYSKTAEDWQKKDEENGNTILEQSIHSLERFGIHAKPILLHGDAATELLEYTHNNRIDLIAIGSRGLSEVRGWLLGSVSRKLVHYAPCSVLVVKQ